MTEQELFEEVAQLVDYNPETGVMTWKWREDVPNWWNKKYAGKECGRVTNRGYRQLGYTPLGRNTQRLLTHRLAWYIVHNVLPKDQIDHIDGQKTNNQIKNLRDVSGSLNMRNQKMSRANTSGVVGVYWHKARGKWRGKVSVNNKKIHIGTFDNISEAEAVVKAFRAKHDFTETHGERT